MNINVEILCNEIERVFYLKVNQNNTIQENRDLLKELIREYKENCIEIGRKRGINKCKKLIDKEYKE